MKLENINFKGETYNFSFSRYSSSNFIAILMGLPNDEYPDIITTNNSVMTKDENDSTEYVQIRTDNPEYVRLLVNNGLIEDKPDFIMPQGYIGIMFFAPTEEFGKLKEKSIVKGHLYDHMEFITMPENEDEFKTLLEKVLNKYS